MGLELRAARPPTPAADASTEEARALARRIMAEPITAIATILIAFLAAVFWELTWFGYPLLAQLLRLPGGETQSADE